MSKINELISKYNISTKLNYTLEDYKKELNELSNESNNNNEDLNKAKNLENNGKKENYNEVVVDNAFYYEILSINRNIEVKTDRVLKFDIIHKKKVDNKYIDRIDKGDKGNNRSKENKLIKITAEKKKNESKDKKKIFLEDKKIINLEILSTKAEIKPIKIKGLIKQKPILVIKNKEIFFTIKRAYDGPNIINNNYDRNTNVNNNENNDSVAEYSNNSTIKNNAMNNNNYNTVGFSTNKKQQLAEMQLYNINYNNMNFNNNVNNIGINDISEYSNSKGSLNSSNNKLIEYLPKISRKSHSQYAKKKKSYTEGNYNEYNEKLCCELVELDTQYESMKKDLIELNPILKINPALREQFFINVSEGREERYTFIKNLYNIINNNSELNKPVFKDDFIDKSIKELKKKRKNIPIGNGYNYSLLNINNKLKKPQNNSLNNSSTTIVNGYNGIKLLKKSSSGKNINKCKPNGLNFLQGIKFK